MALCCLAPKWQSYLCFGQACNLKKGSMVGVGRLSAIHRDATRSWATFGNPADVKVVAPKHIGFKSW